MINQLAEETYESANKLAGEGDYQSAIHLLEKAEAGFNESGHQKWHTFILHEKFRILLETGNLTEAYALIEPIKSGYRKINDFKGLALILIHESNLYQYQENYNLALNRLQSAKSLVEEAGLTTLAVYLNSNIAIGFIKKSYYFKAIEALEEIIELTEEQPGCDEQIWSFWQLGNCYRNLFQVNPAETNLKLAYQGYLKLGDIENCMAVLDELKSLFSDLNRIDDMAFVDRLKIQIQNQSSNRII